MPCHRVTQQVAELRPATTGGMVGAQREGGGGKAAGVAAAAPASRVSASGPAWCCNMPVSFQIRGLGRAGRATWQVLIETLFTSAIAEPCGLPEGWQSIG